MVSAKNNRLFEGIRFVPSRKGCDERKNLPISSLGDFSKYRFTVQYY